MVVDALRSNSGEQAGVCPYSCMQSVIAVICDFRDIASEPGYGEITVCFQIGCEIAMRYFSSVIQAVVVRKLRLIKRIEPGFFLPHTSALLQLYW